MTKLYPKALDLDEERIIEIIERTKNVKKEIDKTKAKNSFYKTYIGINETIERAISLYRIIYKDFINSEEQTILGLYIIINDDKKLLENFLRLKGDFTAIGKYYGVSEKFVTLRFKIYKKIKKYNDNLKNNTDNINKLVLTNKTES